MALSEQDIKAIGKEVLSVVEKCLKNLNQIETINTEQLLNINEVSEKLRIGKQTVYKLIKDNEIQSIKIGKSLYVSIRDFNKYVNSKY